MTVATSGTTPTYADVSDIVEALVNTEGRRYPIPGMDYEDIAQEIRFECFRVLAYFDPNRIGPSSYKYLETCVRNKIYNMRRGIWVPNNPPCARCPMWDRQNRCCSIEEIGCEKIVQYRTNMAKKADLKRPTSLEVDINDHTQESQMDAIILHNSIKDTLPEHLLQPYEALIQGKKITSRHKKQIREIVSSIINNA